MAQSLPALSVSRVTGPGVGVRRRVACGEQVGVRRTAVDSPRRQPRPRPLLVESPPGPDGKCSASVRACPAGRRRTNGQERPSRLRRRVAVGGHGRAHAPRRADCPRGTLTIRSTIACRRVQSSRGQSRYPPTGRWSLGLAATRTAVSSGMRERTSAGAVHGFDHRRSCPRLWCVWSRRRGGVPSSAETSTPTGTERTGSGPDTRAAEVPTPCAPTASGRTAACPARAHRR